MKQALLFVLLAGVSAGAAEMRTRFHEYTAKNKQPADPVQVELATYLGGPGTEWLSGAAYQSDGTLVLAGTALGPEFKLGDSPVAVLGRDGPPPAAPQAGKDAKGRPALPDWTHESGTGFAVWTAPDLRKVLRVVRFPWKTGAVCGVAADATGVYLAGRGGANLGSAGDVQDVTVAGGEPADTASVFVLKVSPQGDRLLWARRFQGAGAGVRLRLFKDNLIVEGRWVYIFSPDGQLKQVLKAGYHHCRAVNPLDFSYAAGWDRNTHTGREPWRQPCLRLIPPEGKGEHKDYYNWPPKDMGSRTRLVSDSSFRRLHFDDQGLLYAIGWSDGGNTVLEREILDVDKPQPHKGLGFSLWGAKVGSFCHVLKIDPAGPKILNKTLYNGYLTGKNEPSSSTVTALAASGDGSLLLTGQTGYGHIQTGDSLEPTSPPPPGAYVTVLSKDWSAIRHSSVLAAAGQVVLHGNKDVFGIAAAKVEGRHKAVFVSSAVEKMPTQFGDLKAPTRNALQETCAGGLCDGYLVIMDLGE